jgi:hypothetical protein
MYQVLWQARRQVMNETERAKDHAAAPLVAPQIATLYDQAYVRAHPELYTTDTRCFHYDRAPLPDEWSGSLLPGCYVRVFVINAWTVVRVLHTPNGTRLQAPMIDVLEARDPAA